MKKTFKFYIIIWAVLLAIYNLTVFLVKPIVPGYVINYDARFWISWSVIIATFIGQLICAKIAFDSKNNEKLFLNIPLITQSYTALIVATIVGSILMLIPDCPAWIAAIVFAVVLGFSVISIVKAKAAADIVSDIDDKVKANTLFIKSLTIDAESLVSKANTQEIKTELKKVYEALRYSDPVSREELKGIENQMAVKFNDLVNCAKTGDYTVIKSLCDEFITLVNDRNNKCKALK